MEQIHNQHYLLELQLAEDKKKWYVFAEGISPLFYRLEGIQHFRIYKQWVETNEFCKKNITWKFIHIQQLYKRRLQLKKCIMKNLRRLETGETTFQQLANRLL